MESLPELLSSPPKSKGTAEATNRESHTSRGHRGRPHNTTAWIGTLLDASRSTPVTTPTTWNQSQQQCPGSLLPITRFCRPQGSIRMPDAQRRRPFMDRRFFGVVHWLLKDAGASASQRDELFWDAYTWLAEYFGQPYLPLRSPYNNHLSRLSPNPPTQLALYGTAAWNRYQREFEEEKLLGSGAFGCVVRAMNKLDKCRYAIKIIPIMDEVESSLQEVRALAELDHPRLVRYHNAWLQPDLQPFHKTWTPATVRESSSDMDNDAVGETFNETSGTENDLSPCLSSASQTESSSSEDGVVFQDSEAASRSRGSEKNPDMALLPYSPRAVPCPKLLFIQMGLCGKSLKDWLDQRNASSSPVVEVSKSLEIFHEIVDGLCCMHRHGYIHRDIKPANIFFTLDGRHIQLGDFGLAKLSACSPAVLSSSFHSGLTPTVQQQNTRCVGTPMYAAPEIQRGNYGPKSDIYSLSIILLELFSVFSTSHEKIEVIKNLKDNRCLDHELKDSWPDIAIWILRLSEPEPASRPSSDELLRSSLFPQPLPPPPSLNTLNTAAQGPSRPVLTNGLQVLQELAGRTEIIHSEFNDVEILKVNKIKTENSITVRTVEQCQLKDEENALLKGDSNALEGAACNVEITESKCSNVKIFKIDQIKTENSVTAHTIEKSKDEVIAILKEENNALKKGLEELKLKVERLKLTDFSSQETEK